MSVILVILSTTFYYLEMKPHIISYIKKIRWCILMYDLTRVYVPNLRNVVDTIFSSYDT